MYTRKGLLLVLRTYARSSPQEKPKASFKCYFLHSKEFKFIHCSPSPYLVQSANPRQISIDIMSMEVTLFQQITLLEMSMDL